MGDGTGCDNMTAVIVRFKPKLLELPTIINPEETEDILLQKRADEAETIDISLRPSLKRSASPTSECGNEAEKITKRMKTDLLEESNEVTDVVASSSSSSSPLKPATISSATECDSGSVASTNTATCSAASST